MKTILLTSLKTCVLIALLTLLIHFHYIDLTLLRKILMRPDVLALGAVAVFLSYMTAALRWWLILRSQKIAIAYLHAFQLYAVSIFLSIFVPGGTASSDVVRSMMSMRIVPGRRGQAVLAVFADRIIAVFVLSLLAAILTFAQWPHWLIARGDPMFWLNLSALLLPILLAIVIYVAWLATRSAKYRTRNDFHNQKWIARAMRKMSEFFELALENRLSVMLAAAASILTVCLLLSVIVIVSTIAAIPTLSSWDIAYAGALSQFVNGLPISPGGVGVGEAAFNQICLWIAHGKQQFPYATIFLAYRIITVLVSCCCGIVFMNMRRLLKPMTERPCLLTESDAQMNR